MTFHIEHSKHESIRRAKQRFRTGIILFLIFILSPLACTPPVTTPDPTASIPVQNETSTTTVETVVPSTLLPATTAVTTTPSTSTLTPTAANSLTFVAEADTQARESRPDTNYGEDPTMRVDGTSDSDY
ncbi:MAG TPA: hypothetical protein VFM05_11290, partial [Candidatus Saccharimonadales bacterium]|nr:hypothetical protein [Candidatus Saccharimonadales bacterium]